jgi:hypothetical protein
VRRTALEHQAKVGARSPMLLPLASVQREGRASRWKTTRARPDRLEQRVRILDVAHGVAADRDQDGRRRVAPSQSCATQDRALDRKSGDAHDLIVRSSPRRSA